MSIAVHPLTDAWKVLELVCRRPGELSAGAIGRILWPAPRLPVPVLQCGGLASAGERLRQWLRDAEDRRLRTEAHQAQAAARAGRLLGRLQSQGLVERERPPRLAPWWADLAEAERAGKLERLYCIDQLPEDEEEYDPAAPVQSGATTLLQQMARLVGEVEKEPSTTAQVLGPKAGGTARRAYAVLVELGIVIPSSFRWPTEAGKRWMEENCDRPEGQTAPQRARRAA
jgi:hypothetical protein